MENRIKDLKNALQADRTSCHRFVANAFRLLEHALAYVLMDHLRRATLRHPSAPQLPVDHRVFTNGYLSGSPSSRLTPSPRLSS